LGIAKSGEAAFSGNAGAGEGHNSSSAAQLLEQRLRKIHSQNTSRRIVTKNYAEHVT
jgi:hypothetical protein